MSETYEDVFVLFNQAYPINGRPPDLMPAGQQYIPAWLASGRTAQQITDDLKQVVVALGAFQAPSGFYNTVRKDAFTGEGDVSQLLTYHELDPANVPMPTNEQIYQRVYGGPAQPPVQPPVQPPTTGQPPVQPPEVTTPPSGISAKDAEQDGRLATLEAQVKGIRDFLGATTGGPGGA